MRALTQRKRGIILLVCLLCVSYLAICIIIALVSIVMSDIPDELHYVWIEKDSILCKGSLTLSARGLDLNAVALVRSNGTNRIRLLKNGARLYLQAPIPSIDGELFDGKLLDIDVHHFNSARTLTPFKLSLDCCDRIDGVRYYLLGGCADSPSSHVLYLYDYKDVTKLIKQYIESSSRMPKSARKTEL